MMRKNNVRRFKKGMCAWLLCLAMTVSVLAPASVANATMLDVENVVDDTNTTNTTNTGTSADTDNTNADPNGVLGKNSDVGIEVTKSITGKAGKNVKVEFKLKSNDTKTVQLKSVYPVIDSTFPFETSGDAYKIVTADDEEKTKELSASYKMMTRMDITTGYHSVRFIGEYTKVEADGSTKDYYVIKTINIYFTGSDYTSDSDDKGKDNSDKKEEEEEEDNQDEEYDDEYDGGSSGGSSDSDDYEPVAPKLLISGYETTPKKVKAGETFKIVLHIQNTSKNVNVCNGKFLIGNEAGSFTPTSGSNAVFVEKIEAGKTGDIEIEMKAGADLQQKNYSLVVKGDFDDGNGNNFTSADSVTIPVYQDVAFAITDVSMTPEVVGVGESAELMFTINNKSSVGVYNVNVSTKSDAVEAKESYVGNIAGSSSAYATMEITGKADNSADGKITIVISYEDSEGTVTTVEEKIACTVSEDGSSAMEDDFTDDEFYDDEEFEEEEGFQIPIWAFIILGIILLVVIVAVIVIVVVTRKKRMAALLEAEDGEDDLYDENF